MAEALGKHLASDVFESYSAGTELRPQINQDAVRLMKQHYNIDMEKTQYSKLVTDIPDMNILITMGCNVNCPVGLCENDECLFEEDWGFDDPSGKSDEEFMIIIKEIERKIKELAQRILAL